MTKNPPYFSNIDSNFSITPRKAIEVYNVSLWGRGWKWSTVSSVNDKGEVTGKMLGE